MIQVTIDGKKYEYPENCSYYEIAKDFEKTIQVIYDTFVTKEKQS